MADPSERDRAEARAIFQHEFVGISCDDLDMRDNESALAHALAAAREEGRREGLTQQDRKDISAAVDACHDGRCDRAVIWLDALLERHEGDK